MVARSLFALLALLAPLFLAMPAGAGEGRVALVIGNGAYGAVSALTNPAADARRLAEALTRLGFDLGGGPLIDADRGRLRDALRGFRDRSREADLALLYYAGHGIQADGVNYLVPTDSRLEDIGDLDLEAVSLGAVLDQMRAAVNVVILDACRDNPYEGRLRSASKASGRLIGLGRGLAGIDSTRLGQGSLIAMAAAPGQVAQDGPEDGNSPYAAALLHHLATPGLDIGSLFRRVREEVERTTAGRQRPEAIDRLPARAVSLVPGVDSPGPASGVASRPAAGQSADGAGGAVGTTPGPSIGATIDPDAMACAALERSTRGEGFAAYLQEFPAGRCAAFARIRLAELGGGGGEAGGVARAPQRDTHAAGSGGLALGEERAGDNSGVGGSHPAEAGVGRAAGVGTGVGVGVGVGVDTGSDAGGRMGVGGAGAGTAPAMGHVFRDCPVCPEMIVIPPGGFAMGSSAAEVDRDDDEGPVHPVRIAAPLAVGKVEVTFEEWEACVEADACRGYSPDDEGWGRLGRPVMQVSWHDAQAYVAWLRARTGLGYRLPSEAEWEYAARAGTTTARFWGNPADTACAHANVHDLTAAREGNLPWAPHACEDGYPVTAPVGALRPNRFGLHDMLGNVAEWVEDCGHPDYAGAPNDGGSWESGVCGERVVRGGSWSSSPQGVRSAYRDARPPDYRLSDLGFRVVRTLNTDVPQN